MFDFVRSHTRLLQGLLVLLIFPSFVFFGVQGYSRFTDGSSSSVAEVDGRAISRAEWDSTHQRNVERLRQQMPGIDVKMLDTPEMRRQSLEGIVRERVLLAAATKLNLGVSDERLARVFQSDPQFAAMRNPDGSVNRDLLAAQGMSSEVFAQQLRTDIAMRQVLLGVNATAVAPQSVAATALDALLQRREIQLQRFDAKDYRAKVSPTDEQIDAYYKANESQFRAPEQASIEYVVLDLEGLKKTVTAPEDELRRYYTENAARYTTAEQRRASHILIKSEKGDSAEQRAKAKAKAEALLADLRKTPGQFAELARKNSDDPGSAANGGDLDFFGRNAMVKPFEDAAFAMKPGEISNLVESEFGFHIIQLVAVRGGDKKSFEEVRGEIESELKTQLARKRYAEVAEQFSNTVYEQSDSLQPVIDRLKLEKRTATVQRKPVPGATGALGSAKLLDSVFSNDAITNKRNTEAVEVGPSQLAAARIVQHMPSRILPLADVKPQVRDKLVGEQAAALAKKEGQERLAQVKADAAAALPQALTVSRMQAQEVPRALVDAVLKAPADKLPAAVGVDLGEQGYAVARILKVLPRDPAAGGSDRDLQAQYGQAWASAEAQAYLVALKDRFKAEIKPAAGAASAAGR